MTVKVVSIAALVIAVVALGFGAVALLNYHTMQGAMNQQNDQIVREVEALGGWGGQFTELQPGQAPEGYVLVAYFTDRLKADQFAKSLANIEEYGVMAIQPTDSYTGWMVYRTISS
jgi:hypothetical protein